MSQTHLQRRDVLKVGGSIAAASALAGMSVPAVHAAENNTIQVALVGCGGRGTGAATQALSTKSGPIKLVAMADAFKDRLDSSFGNLSKHPNCAVTEDKKFVGLDAYKQALDCLKPGDIAIFATPPAFRWVHFTYAIQKNLNVFMEKPVTVDGPTSKRMFALGEEAQKKNLKVGVGLMCRHCDARWELFNRLKNGEIGDLNYLRCYRAGGPGGNAYATKNPGKASDLEWQIRRFHSFLWASGGIYSDYLIHNIDECCWMKDAWPVEAKGFGGRHYRNGIDQNFDIYDVEYTFPDGTKMFLVGRYMPNCHNEFASYVHGTKGSAVISTAAHTPAKCKIYKSQQMTKENLTWAFPDKEPNPYQLEWDHLVEAIRSDKPYNEVKRGVEASLVTSMGRMAAHTGQIIKRDDILNCDHEFAPNVDKLTIDGPAPLVADKEGKYPVPQPGLVTKREYA